MGTSPHQASRRSPVLAIAASLVAGLLLAIVLVVGPTSDGTEAVTTGAVLLSFGLGWALMAFLTTWFSVQPQRWAMVPAAFLGIVGLALVVFQPGVGRATNACSIYPLARRQL